jgi:RNA polymerase sigma-70 factor (ECF subfamily)
MASEEPSDAELMRRIVGHDEAALEALFNRHASAVMGLALKILGEREQADEVVQETFWRAWSKAESYQAERGATLSWLFGIAHHLAIDRTRRRAAAGERSALGEGEDIDSQDEDLTEIAWVAARRRQVLAALAELGSEQRKVLELAYFGGLTHHEIAEATETPLGTVHTRARLGLQKLRNALLAHGFEFD